MDKKSVGPSFHDIAVKYKDDPGARRTLIEVVRNGGKGKWPDSNYVPMPPYSARLSPATIERLVNWVLILK